MPTYSKMLNLNLTEENVPKKLCLITLLVLFAYSSSFAAGWGAIQSAWKSKQGTFALLDDKKTKDTYVMLDGENVANVGMPGAGIIAGFDFGGDFLLFVSSKSSGKAISKILVINDYTFKAQSTPLPGGLLNVAKNDERKFMTFEFSSNKSQAAEYVVHFADGRFLNNQQLSGYLATIK